MPGFTAQTVVDLQVPCTYDFEVTGAKYLAALDRGEVPLEFLFSGTVFYTAAGGALQTAMISWDARPSTGCRSASGARPWTATSPAPLAAAGPRDAFDRLYAYRARHALPSWEHALDRLLGPEEGRPDGPVRRIADAVLYEGYVLWPYRRSALKNQRRWTFGGVYPNAHTAAHPDDPCVMQTQCLREGDGGPRLEVRVRFLHVVERRVARLTASGREPSTS